MNIICVVPMAAAEGVFRASFSERGLARLEFPAAAVSKAKRDAGDGKAAKDFQEGKVTPEQRKWLRLTREALEKVFAGRKPAALPPLDWAGASEFQVRTWEGLLEIPLGETRSYGELARAIGHPGAARAVGGACGANPIPVLVPCHRVVAQSGGLGGYSGGLRWKQLLLERERAWPPAKD